MRAFALSFLFSLFLVLGSNAASAAKGEPFGSLNAEDIVSLRENNESFVLIDSRGRKYFEGELIEGAVYLPTNETDGDALAEIIPSKDTKVVFYCSNTSCQASALSAFKAHHAGYSNVFKYPGGIEDWKAKGLPVAVQ